MVYVIILAPPALPLFFDFTAIRILRILLPKSKPMSGFSASCFSNNNKSSGRVKWSQCIRQYLRELKDTVVVIDYTCTYVHV